MPENLFLPLSANCRVALLAQDRITSSMYYVKRSTARGPHLSPPDGPAHAAVALRPPGEGGAKRRMRVYAPALHPDPLPGGEGESSRLGIVREIVRRGRPPHIERILWRVVAALPVAIGGHKIDAGGIFAETAPGVADIMEKVGAEDMPSETPSPREALVQHMHGAAADVVDRAYIPAQMMQSRRARFDEGDHVMIAAVNPVQEGDAVAGPIGEAQTQRARIELNRLLDVSREHEHMRQATGHDTRDLAPERRAAHAWAAGDLCKIGLLAGRGFRRDLDFDEVAVVIVEPKPVRFDAWGRIQPLDAQRGKPLGEAIKIVVERAERDMPKLLARTLAEGDPDMRIAAGLHGEETAVLVDLESELAIEMLGDREIGNRKMKSVDRMDAEFAGTSGRLDGGANGGHGASSRSPIGDAAKTTGGRRWAILGNATSGSP